MGPNEKELNTILSGPAWSAPELLPLEQALGPINQVLGDLSQPDPTKWSGAAATAAAASFTQLRARYHKAEIALSRVRAAVDKANTARDQALSESKGLPSKKVPQWVYDRVNDAQAAGKGNEILEGFGHVASNVVSAFESWLGEDREEAAHEILATFRTKIVPLSEEITKNARVISEAAGYEFPDPVPGPDPTSTGWEIPGPPGQRVPRPVTPLPGIKPGKPPEYGISPPVTGPWPGNPGPGPGVPTPIQPPGEGTNPWPPRTGGPTPSPYPYPGDGGGGTGGTGGGGAGSGDGDYPYGRRPDVDSGSAGTIGNPGLSAGLLGGGALAGGAALRWGSRGGAGLQGLGANGAAGPGGVGGSGGLLGSGGTGSGAGGVAGGRGLAGGLPGGSGTAGGAGAAGMGAKAGGGAGGGMMAGGGAGGGANDGKKGQKSGLGGHIAPKLEDDDDFIAQSDSARAGSREDLQ